MSRSQSLAYDRWIQAYAAHQPVYGKCAEATLEMQAAFPELQRVRGHYHCLVWGKREHWWLVTETGRIIDPTASQFPSGGYGEYEAWIEGSPEPTGLCANCGREIFGGRDTVCSDECGQDYATWITKNARNRGEG